VQNANGRLIGPIHQILKNFAALEDRNPFFLKILSEAFIITIISKKN
jgi:hypothetical protein